VYFGKEEWRIQAQPKSRDLGPQGTRQKYVISCRKTRASRKGGETGMSAASCWEGMGFSHSNHRSPDRSQRRGGIP